MPFIETANGRRIYRPVDEPSRKTLWLLEKEGIVYPTPKDLYAELTSNCWPYKRNAEYLILRDRAFISTVYVLSCRCSEALRLTRGLFRTDKIDYEKGIVTVEPFQLSKSRIKDVPRYYQTRDGYLPLNGDRAIFTPIILKYLETFDSPSDLIFPITRKRVFQIAKATIPKYCTHWLRAFAEDQLYEEWNYDIKAVADYAKVDIRTVEKYVRSRWKRHIERSPNVSKTI